MCLHPFPAWGAIPNHAVPETSPTPSTVSSNTPPLQGTLHHFKARKATPLALQTSSAPGPRTTSSGGPNDDLLALALAERAKGSSSPRRSASPTTGQTMPVASAHKPAADAGSGSSGPNDNLLALALAERAKGSSSPRRSDSPTSVSASPKVGPF